MKTVVVKVGGAALAVPFALESACRAIAEFRSQGARLIVVHGGGPAINKALEEKGITWNFFEGQRITTPEMMTTIEEALWGVNRRLGSILARLGVPFLGINGKDGGLLNCVAANPNLGEVGEVRTVGGAMLVGLMNHGITPLICPVGHGGGGKALNVNADWAAARIASAVRADELLFLTDQSGILDQQSIEYPRLTAHLIRQLIFDGVVTGGMLAKTRAILDAIAGGVEKVYVIPASRAIDFAEGTVLGTRCTLSADEDIYPQMPKVLHAVR